MRVVRTSKLSTNAAAIHYKVSERSLRAYFDENKRNETVLYHSRSYPRELLGYLKLGTP